MMKTIKLPYQCSVEDRFFIKEEIGKSTNMVRYAFNRFKDNKTEKEIRLLSKNLSNIPHDSWYIQCAIKKAKYLYSANKEKVIFGGKQNFFKRLQNKIPKDEYKTHRLLSIYSQGETPQKGNRKFNLDILNKQIIFKFSKNKHIPLKLPKLHKNYLTDLTLLEEYCSTKQANFSIELSLNYISITFDETKIFHNNYAGKNDIIASIDMNPNYIGFSISKWKGKTKKILLEEQYDLSYYTQNLHKSSKDKLNIYQCNKHRHEIKEIAKTIIKTCKHFKVGKFAIEDLSFKNKNANKSKNFNRLVNNMWKRDILSSALEKHCILNNINFITVNPVYSSFIGNLCEDAPDPIAASLEIARRANFKYIKGLFYPTLISKSTLFNQWKESALWNYKSWKELFDIVKTAKVKYRRSLDSYKFKVFSLKTPKSKINLYKIYNCLAN